MALISTFSLSAYYQCPSSGIQHTPEYKLSKRYEQSNSWFAVLPYQFLHHLIALEFTMQQCRIKADRPLMGNTLNTPWLLTNRQFQWTGNGHCNYHWLNSASQVLISTCSAPLVQTGERKQFSPFDIDLWLTTLTYNPRLAKFKVDLRAKNQGQMSTGSNRRAPTNAHTRTNGQTHKNTHGRYQTY